MRPYTFEGGGPPEMESLCEEHLEISPPQLGPGDQREIPNVSFAQSSSVLPITLKLSRDRKRGKKRRRGLQHQSHTLVGSRSFPLSKLSSQVPWHWHGPSWESPVRVSSVRCSGSPRCRVPRALAQCGWPVSGRCARCTWRPLRSSSSCYDRRDPCPSAAASHPGRSTVADASGLADCSPRECFGPKAPTAFLSCGGSGDSLGVWREVGRFFWQIGVPTPV